MTENKTCTWKLDASPYAEIWEADCGLTWSLEEGGPEENGMNYCPKCGKKLVAVYPASDGDKDILSTP